MTKLTIDTDLPPPPPTTGRPFKYPFPVMKVGDSFTVPLAGTMQGTEDRATSRLRAAASRHSRFYGVRFSIRTDREAGVARCWRVG